MRGWWQDFTDLVLPADCAGCGRPRTVLCPGCRAVLSGAAPCRVRPVPEPAGLPVVHAAARYADETRAVLLAHKERGALALAAPLGAALAGAVRAGLEGLVGGGQGRGEEGAPAADSGPAVAAAPRRPILLVPVPSARRAVRARGHDPARRIALAAAGELRRTGTPARVAAVLRQRRAVADQSGLGSRERLDNLLGALTVVPGGAGLLRDGGPVVLVDDLMTTGASLTEAARAVRAAAGTDAAVRDRGERDSGGTAYRTAGTSVYPGAVWEGRKEQKSGATEERVDRVSAGSARPGGIGVGEAIRDVIRAAVVAASPDSFRMNRN